MKKTTIHSLRYVSAVAIVCTALSCSTSYRMSHVERSQITVDQRYDQPVSAEITAFLQPYKQRIDSTMSPQVGVLARDLEAFRPESPLSNLLADILMWSGKAYDEQPDFAVYNIGGMRAALPKGVVTVGDVLEVAPFDNRICFVSLKGSLVKELFGQIALQGGEGVSRDVMLKITADGKLVDARLNGLPIADDDTYRIVTIDYVSKGNDRMVAFQQSFDKNEPRGESNNVRYVIADYLRTMHREGIVVDRSIEGRILIVKP